MSQRLVPYRDDRTQHGQAAIMTIVFGLVGFTTKIFCGDIPAAVAGVTAMYAAIPISNWLARGSGAELVSPAEAARRQTLERAAKSIATLCIESATGLTSTIVVAMFVVTPTDYWGDLPVPAVVGGALFLGLIWGAYLSINARRDARRTERGGDQPEEVEDPGGQASPPTTTAESVVRHYLGYVVALAMGLFVAAAVKDRTIAAMAMFVAFVLSKFAIDMLLPSVRPAVVKGKMRLMHVIVAIPFGVLAWGLPLGAFVVALALTLEPSMSLVHLTTLFALTLIIVGIGSALAVATAWFMNLVPEDSLPAREQGDV